MDDLRFYVFLPQYFSHIRTMGGNGRLCTETPFTTEKILASNGARTRDRKFSRPALNLLSSQSSYVDKEVIFTSYAGWVGISPCFPVSFNNLLTLLGEQILFSKSWFLLREENDENIRRSSPEVESKFGKLCSQKGPHTTLNHRYLGSVIFAF